MGTNQVHIIVLKCWQNIHADRRHFDGLCKAMCSTETNSTPSLDCKKTNKNSSIIIRTGKIEVISHEKIFMLKYLRLKLRNRNGLEKDLEFVNLILLLPYSHRKYPAIKVCVTPLGRNDINFNIDKKQSSTCTRTLLLKHRSPVATND